MGHIFQYHLKESTSISLVPDRTAPCAQPSDENDIGKWRNQEKLDFPNESAGYDCQQCWSCIQYYLKKFTAFYWSQIEPHHAFSRLIRFDVGKFMYLLHWEYKIQSNRQAHIFKYVNNFLLVRSIYQLIKKCRCCGDG